MTIDATFWVAISFFIFIGALFYLKVPQKVNNSLLQKTEEIKNEIEEAEKLKNEAKNLLSEYENKIDKSKKSTEQKILQMKENALKDIKNTSVQISISAVKNLIKKSIDDKKLEKIYKESLEEAKISLKKIRA